MLEENFEKLEQKIKKVLELVDRLKEESKQSGSSYSHLSNRIFEFEEKNKALIKENNEFKSQIKEIQESIKGKEEKARQRIEKLLNRLTEYL